MAPNSPRLVGAALLLLLTASVAGNLYLYPRATRPLFEERERDRPLIERTHALAAANERVSVDMDRAHSFPIATHRGDRTCIELRARDGLGYSGACYDRGGTMVEESAGVTD
jgi:hypothetical protein